MRFARFRSRSTVRAVLTLCAFAAAGATAVRALEPREPAKPQKQPPKRSAVAEAAVRDTAQPVRRPPVVRPRIVRPRVAAVQIPAGTNALILADRRTIQRLSLAKKLLTQKDYLQAVGLLQKVIEREKDAFYYPDPTKRDSIQSVRNSAQRMIGGMPKAGKEAYKLKFGGTAKALLTEAESAGNFQKIAEIARRYFHTDAGFSAMYRLGLLHYDQGRPLAAALCFERLRGRPDAEAKWEPVLSLRAAVCWHRAGMPKKVADALETVRKTAAGKPVVVGGQPVALFANPDEGAAWLARNFGSAGLPDRIADSDWTMFRGDRARNAVVRLPEQASNRSWKKTLIPDPTTDFYDARPDPAQSQTATRTQLRSAVASMANQFQQQQWNVFPSTHPVAVGNTLLTRTVSGLRAIDVQTGKALWESFPDELLETLVTADGKQPVPSSTSHIRQLVGQRVWGDMTWGGLSTNGELVYCIEDVALQYPVRVPTDNPRTFKTLTADRRVNRLVAYSVRSNRRVWSIGGPAADLEPNDFAGTFFLGSPIQLAGRLYCLVEVNGEVRLHAYELKSPGSRVPPELVWSQPLIGANQRIDNDRRRRIAGTTISYADGILVCPTDAGYVIAVDVTTRSLLWGYRYEQPSRRPRFPRPRPQPQPGRTSRWLDSTCTIDRGKVLITPRGTDEIVCLDLIDGRVLWKQKRLDGLYVAGIRDGSAVVVGSGGVRALKMTDGTAAWKQSLTLPTPSGRGFATENRLIIPLSTGEIATVELKSGKLAEKVKTPGGRIPGNLILANGVLISHGTDTIEAIPLPSLKANVAGR